MESRRLGVAEGSGPLGCGYDVEGEFLEVPGLQWSPGLRIRRGGNPAPGRIPRDRLSAPHPACGYDGAETLHREGPEQRKVPPPGPPEPPAGGAVLEGSRIQDLAEIVPAMLEASAGSALRFHVRVALDGEAPKEVRTALDALLAGVSEDLKTT